MNVNEFDLAFVVDTTASMGSFIDAAKTHMINMIDKLRKESSVDIQLGLVEYRDHPPQDSMVYRHYPFTSDMKQVRKDITNLRVAGGGDGPEAVFDGIIAACEELEWREHSRKVMVLIGDAPPHGVGCSGDGFSKGCPCGQTVESVANALEENSTLLYSLGLGLYSENAEKSFSRMSQLSGGQYFSASRGDESIKNIQGILAEEFKDLESDREVLDMWQDGCCDKKEIAEKLEYTMQKVLSSLSRLRARKLI